MFQFLENVENCPKRLFTNFCLFYLNLIFWIEKRREIADFDQRGLKMHQTQIIGEHPDKP